MAVTGHHVRGRRVSDGAGVLLHSRVSSLNSASRLFLGIICFTALPIACSDTAVTGDAGAGDAGITSGDAAPDAQTAACEFPAPVVGGTAATDLLADLPQRCGQPAFSWLRTEDLGSIVRVGEPRRFEASVFPGLLEAAGISIPFEMKYAASVRTFTYRTQDRGQLIEATAAVAYPDPGPPGESLDVMLLLHGTNGFSDGCGVATDLLTQGLSAALASLGRVVVVPDYIGLRTDGGETGFWHPYLAGRPAAISSLDAVRAAAQLTREQRGGACLNPRFATIGMSQGGHATLWVDRLAPYYARELTHVGAVAAVPPADLLGESEIALTKISNSTSNAAAFLATVPSWYGAGDQLDRVFAEPFVSSIDTILAQTCKPHAFNQVEQLSDVFATDLLDAVAQQQLASYAPFGCMVSENGLTTTSVTEIGSDLPNYAMLFVTGEIDDLVDTATERKSFQTLCEEQGMPLHYLECAGAGHEAGTTWAMPEILRFLDDRYAGRAPDAASRCVLSAPVRCEGTPADVP